MLTTVKKERSTQLRAQDGQQAQVFLTLENPSEAFSLAGLPVGGVGLVQLEFMLMHSIQIHPLALIHFDQVQSSSERERIGRLTRHYEDGQKAQFFVDRLAQGLGTIAAAFYPRPVIVRFSNLTSTEFALLLGGSQFELQEENPQIGWRGASRYTTDRYRAAFALECQALRRVRDGIGLTNIIPMVPFCRTPAEGRRVLEEMAQHGLEQGKNELQVYLMAELPSHVMQAEAFCTLFDGLSVNLDSLTQLALGLDQASERLTEQGEGQNEVIERMVQHLLAATRKYHRPLGLCRESPGFSQTGNRWLGQPGVPWLSLRPDAAVQKLATILV
ncbi:hypothetical protein BST81_14370 [Leptolyngbya sp. 'hensonii']|uniref:putative PEP-binding protein n=1 Tax=Leptolyngbya sp. 'hensonii' TaxID=1922337 RepID=UPI00094F9B35|nr:putative PEP-binding protein [Leptolyngbya sp. 'hensonii']OLP17521.1 hypothetical protein BST81_14370 [Leptolyngbya sp. 'hensonii']